MRSLRNVASTVALTVILAAVTVACGSGESAAPSAHSSASVAASGGDNSAAPSATANTTPVCTLITKVDIQRLIGQKIVSSDNDNITANHNDPDYCEYLVDGDFNGITVYRIPKDTMDLSWKDTKEIRLQAGAQGFTIDVSLDTMKLVADFVADRMAQ